MLKSLIDSYNNNIKGFCNENEISIEEKIEMLEKNHGTDDKFIDDELNKIFGSILTNEKTDVKLNRYVFDEIEMFEDLEHNTNSGVYSKINMTTTKFGNRVLKQILMHPTIDCDLLLHRQLIIKKFIDSDTLTKINGALESVSNSEQEILWHWRPLDEHISSLLDLVYFKFKPIMFLNKQKRFLRVINTYTVLISPISSICSPLVYLIIPFITMKFMKVPLSFSTYIKFTLNSMFNFENLKGTDTKLKLLSIISILVWTLFYGNSVYQSINLARSTHKVINIIHKKLNIIYNVMLRAEELSNIMRLNSINLDFDISQSIRNLRKIFYNRRCFTCDPNLFSNKGEILGTFTEFTENKHLFIDIIKYIGMVDAYASVAKLFSNQTFCFPTYVKSNTPLVHIKKLWHPFYLENNVYNDIYIDEKKDKNLLITGPNATGKSTYIKAATLAILLSQSLAIAPGNKMKMAPYNYIFTHVNIRDCKGKASLFEAEMNRCKEFFDTIKTFKNNELSFIIMDEILSSTNFEEGFSAAYAICLFLTEQKNNTALITTHFTELSRLQRRTKKNISNYHFNIQRDVNNNITCSYKIKSGLSRDKIALELLDKNGFDSTIIKNAIKLCKSIRVKIKIPKKVSLI